MPTINTITVHFGSEIANLYDIGYLSTDIYQIFAFSQLLEENKRTEVKRWFGEKARPFNRYAPVLEKRKRTAEITEVRNGSVELAVATGSLLTSIIVPLAIIYVQRAMDAPVISFEVSIDDQEIQKALNAYAQGTFGAGAKALDLLFAALRQLGYDVKLQGQDAYIIDDVLQRYSRRMIRTIRRK